MVALEEGFEVIHEGQPADSGGVGCCGLAGQCEDVAVGEDGEVYARGGAEVVPEGESRIGLEEVEPVSGGIFLEVEFAQADVIQCFEDLDAKADDLGFVYELEVGADAGFSGIGSDFSSDEISEGDGSAVEVGMEAVDAGGVAGDVLLDYEIIGGSEHARKEAFELLKGIGSQRLLRPLLVRLGDGGGGPADVAIWLEDAGQRDRAQRLSGGCDVVGEHGCGHGEMQSLGQGGESNLACQILDQLLAGQEEVVVAFEGMAVARDQEQEGIAAVEEDGPAWQSLADGDQVVEGLVWLGERIGDDELAAARARVQSEIIGIGTDDCGCDGCGCEAPEHIEVAAEHCRYGFIGHHNFSDVASGAIAGVGACGEVVVLRSLSQMRMRLAPAASCPQRVRGLKSRRRA